MASFITKKNGAELLSIDYTDLHHHHHRHITMY